MASNEKQPIMFYRSLMEKLFFENEEELRELISNNRELFWPMSDSVLKSYKKHYKSNHDFCPKWMSDGKTFEEIDATIDLLQSKNTLPANLGENLMTRDVQMKLENGGRTILKRNGISRLKRKKRDTDFEYSYSGNLNNCNSHCFYLSNYL